MSYEGYDQFLCPAGHAWDEDALCVMYELKEINCPVCGQKPVWRNAVDQTNDDGSEYVVELVEKTPAQYKCHECKCCDKVFTEQIAGPTYHIPTDKGRMI